MHFRIEISDGLQDREIQSHSDRLIAGLRIPSSRINRDLDLAGAGGGRIGAIRAGAQSNLHRSARGRRIALAQSSLCGRHLHDSAVNNWIVINVERHHDDYGGILAGRK